MLLELPVAMLQSLGAVDSDGGHCSGLTSVFLRIDQESCVYCVSRFFVEERPTTTLHFCARRPPP